MTPEIAAYARQVCADAPPLTPEQISRLVAILRPRRHPPRSKPAGRAA